MGIAETRDLETDEDEGKLEDERGERGEDRVVSADRRGEHDADDGNAECDDVDPRGREVVHGKVTKVAVSEKGVDASDAGGDGTHGKEDQDKGPVQCLHGMGGHGIEGETRNTKSEDQLVVRPDCADRDETGKTCNYAT